MAQGFGNAFGANVQTGIDPNLAAPTVADSVYSRLAAAPAQAQSAWMNQVPGLNSLYQQNILGKNMGNAAALHSLVNQQTAQNNLNLGNLQSGLSTRGMQMAANQALYGLQRQQQLRNMLLGLFGNMFGSVMGSL